MSPAYRGGHSPIHESGACASGSQKVFIRFANLEDVHAWARRHLFVQEYDQELWSTVRHVPGTPKSSVPPARRAGPGGPTEHDDSGILDFAPDVGERRGPRIVEIGDCAGCGAVDAESAAGESSEDASAGTAEVIAQSCRRVLSYLRLLCSRLLSKPPPAWAPEDHSFDWQMAGVSENDVWFLTNIYLYR